MKLKVAQLCLTLCDPMDYTVLRILQVRIREWVAFPSSRGSSQPRDQTQVSPHCRQILYQLSHREDQEHWTSIQCSYPFSSGSSRPRNRSGVSCIARRFFASWAIREITCVLYLHMEQAHSQATEKWAFQRAKELWYDLRGAGVGCCLMEQVPKSQFNNVLTRPKWDTYQVIGLG